MTGHRRVRVGIDTGGTFTDVVAVDEDTGELVTTKTPSTPSDPAEGFMAGIEKIRGMCGDEVTVTSVSHGTTVATNQLLEDSIEGLGFITTEGYEFILEIARQAVPDGYGNSYFWVKPDRIVPPDLVYTVGGRLDHTGAEVRPLNEDDVARAARQLRDKGINTIGVNLLHAYANPEHEERVLQIVLAEHPNAVVSLSSRVLREYREYERAMTTLVDAAVKPRVTKYVAQIRERLDGSFHIMKSNGGVLSAEELVHQPISTVLSGPAAGALGAALISQRAGFNRVVTLDGGGTSTDVSVVLDGEPTVTTEGSIGRYPVKTPMIDIVTVGAGGGSIAWISPEGTLKVGPQSAGASPGPLCYGGKGTEPTITDAHAMLGRIPPHLLGGEFPLETEAARTGVVKLGEALGLTPEKTATGILEISAWNQANALRQITVKRGLDIRDFHITSFGGSGALLVCRLIDILGTAGAIVPPDPGNVSAYGLLTVDVRNDYVRTAVMPHDDLDYAGAADIFDGLTQRAAAALETEGFDAEQHQFLRSADLRYEGQAFEVRVPVPDGQLTPELAAKVAESFHEAHNQLYGYDLRDAKNQPVEWVNLRVTGVGPIERPQARPLEELPGGLERAQTATRSVYFDEQFGYQDTPIYTRGRLSPGDTFAGPAVIEEFGSTIPLHPGFTATIDRFGNIVITQGEDA